MGNFVFPVSVELSDVVLTFPIIIRRVSLSPGPYYVCRQGTYIVDGIEVSADRGRGFVKGPQGGEE